MGNPFIIGGIDPKRLVRILKEAIFENRPITSWGGIPFRKYRGKDCRFKNFKNMRKLRRG